MTAPRPRADVDEDLADEDRCGCTVCAAGAYRPAPAAPSLVAGAIGRGLVDAAESYRRQLLDDYGPWDD